MTMDIMHWYQPQLLIACSSFDFAPLKQKAIDAIDAVLSDSSEIKELWEENEELYSAWREDKISMRERLR